MHMLRFLIIAAALLWLVACQTEPEPTQVPAPTSTPTAALTATQVLEPTTGPTPSPTAAPTSVPAAPPLAATDTPVPTVTPLLEPTPSPEAIEGPLFLQLIQPEETEVFVQESSIKVVGRTRVDAVITVNDMVVEPNIDGQFESTVPLEIGANIIEVVVSVASGEQKDLVLVVIYTP